MTVDVKQVDIDLASSIARILKGRVAPILINGNIDVLLEIARHRHQAEAASASNTILKIAKAAHIIGWRAGVGGMETAGMIVSYLAAHQDQIAPFLADEVSPIDWSDFTDGGCLTWHAQQGGRIVHPSEVRKSTDTPDQGLGSSPAPENAA